MDWFRWHHGTVNDPKWSVIARRAKVSRAEVLAVFAAFLERASQSEERGSIAGWDGEDIAAGLDMEPEQVAAIHQAMQGKVLEGDILSGWEKRQPKRERVDNSGDRVKAFRERQRHVTPCNATETHETPRGDKSRVDNNNPPLSPQGGKAKGSRLKEETLPEDWRQFATSEGHRSPEREFQKFRDYWTAQPGQKGVKADWFGTWRNWVRKAIEDQPKPHVVGGYL